MNIYSIESALALSEQEKKEQIIVEGLLEEIEEDFDKAGRPYVKCIIADKGLQLLVKAWQTSLSSFLEKTNIKRTEPVVVQIQGKLDCFNNTYNLIINGCDSVSIVDKKIEEYIYAAPYAPGTMYNGILKQVNEMKNPIYNKICKTVLEQYKDKLLIFPYSSVTHTERSGLLYHMYLCICKEMHISGLPVIASNPSKIDEELIKAAIICSHLGVFSRYQVDNLGKIILKDDIPKYLMGGELYNLLCINDIINQLILTKSITPTPEIDHLLHCVGCICGTPFVPATAEAELSRNIVLEELRLYKTFEEYNTLAHYETRKIKCTKGDRTIIHMPVIEYGTTDNMSEETSDEVSNKAS